MKRLLIILMILILSASALSTGVFAQTAPSESLRGIWVASVYNIDYPDYGTTDPAKLRAQAIEILDNVEAMGLNAVFLQVRPTADALYDSKYFPWSKYLTGTQGVAPSGGFDPLEFWIEEAHARGIQIHAWINPYRITKNDTGRIQDAWDSLTDDHIAKKRRDLVVEHTDGNLYFNPGMPEVANIIAAGVLEIIQNYDVDGIHFDDYFYPSTSFNDSSAYALYGKGYASLADFRRASVTEMVRTVSELIDRIDPSVEFGISPFGIWANASSNPLGSATRGNQSYYAHYADSRLWVKEELVDYIMPQIYWNIGYNIADYAILVDWWEDVVAGTNVSLYIGHAAYKQGNTDQSSAWAGDFELFRQLLLNKRQDEVDGSVFFSYSSFENRPSLMTAMGQYFADVEQTVIAPPTSVTQVSDHLDVTEPSGTIQTAYNGYFLSGTSDPDLPLFVNGTPITDRSETGYFGTFQTLKNGSNTFTFTQSGQTVTRVIEKVESTWTPTPVTTPQLVQSTAAPSQMAIYSGGDTVTLSVYAPIGATVSATVGGQTLVLSPRTTYDYGGAAIYNTQFSGTYTVKAPAAGTQTSNWGKVTYTMTYRGQTSTTVSSGSLLSLAADSRIMVKVTSPYADLFDRADATDGARGMLTLDMADYLEAMSGDFYRLSSGDWIRKADVKIINGPARSTKSVTAATYTVGTETDRLTLSLQGEALATASFDGTYLTLVIPGTEGNAVTRLPWNALFDTLSADGDTYRLHLRSGQDLNGFLVEKIDGGLTVRFMHKPSAGTSSTPLRGVSILLDAGHGGSESGALGILKAALPEKAINLAVATELKSTLEGLGATVQLTREGDTDVSLKQRLRDSYAALPDLFVSLHVDSITPDRDINQVEGVTVYLDSALANGAADAILNQILGDLNRASRGIRTNNFYVARGTWAPHVLVEMGYMVNPVEFDALDDAAGRQAMAQAIADGIVKYFR